MDARRRAGSTRRAVVVGISYKNSIIKKADHLPGCINDARAIRQILTDKYGFRPSDVEFITDEPGSKAMPTGANIMAALNRMVHRAQPGDLLLFHFSGHGTLIPARASKTKKEEEAIVPWDPNPVTCVDFRRLVKELPRNTNFTFLADSCHSGGLIEGGTEQIGPGKQQDGPKWDKMVKPRGRALMYDDDDDDDDEEEEEEEEEDYHVEITRPRMIAFEDLMDQVSTMTGNNNQNMAGSNNQIFTSALDHAGSTMTGGDIQNMAGNYTHQNVADHMVNLFGNTASSLFRLPSHQLPKAMPENGILISACQRNEKAYECMVKGKSYGCFTYALLTRLREHRGGQISNRQLVLNVREIIQKMVKQQHPCLYCSNHNTNAPFGTPNHPYSYKSGTPNHPYSYESGTPNHPYSYESGTPNHPYSYESGTPNHPYSYMSA